MRKTRLRRSGGQAPLLLAALLALLATSTWAQTGPALTIEEPRDQADLASTDQPLDSVPVTVSYTALGGVEKVELWVDDQLQFTDEISPPEAKGRRSYLWNAKAHGPGEHVLAIRIVSGNEDKRGQVTVRIGSGVEPGLPAAPELRVVNPVAQQILRDRVPLEAEIVGGQAQWVGFYLDNSHIGAVFAPPFRYNIDTALSQDGVHVLRARARMRDGSFIESAPIRVTFANSGLAVPVGPTGTAVDPAGGQPEILVPPGASSAVTTPAGDAAPPGPLPIPPIDLAAAAARPVGDLAPVVAPTVPAEPTTPTGTAPAPAEPGWTPLTPPTAPEIAGPEATVPAPTGPPSEAAVLPDALHRQPDEPAVADSGAPPAMGGAAEPALPPIPSGEIAGPTTASTAASTLPSVPDPTVAAPELPAPGAPEVAGPTLGGLIAPLAVARTPEEIAATSPPEPALPAEPTDVGPAAAGPEIAGPVQPSVWRQLTPTEPAVPVEPAVAPAAPDEPSGEAPTEEIPAVLPLLAGPTSTVTPEPGVLSVLSAEPSAPAAPPRGGGIRLEVDGTEMALSAPAVVNAENALLVPLRDFAAREGIVTKWDATAKTVRGYRGMQLLFSATAGADEMTIGGQTIRLRPAPELRDATLFVPLAFLAEAFQYSFDLDEAASTVRVHTAAGVQP